MTVLHQDSGDTLVGLGPDFLHVHLDADARDFADEPTPPGYGVPVAVEVFPHSEQWPSDFEYAAVKVGLAADPTIDIDTYIARKSNVLQKVLAQSDLTSDELLAIWRLNDPGNSLSQPPLGQPR